jgi:hypothetical protein
MVNSLYDLALDQVAKNYVENPKDQPCIGNLINYHKIVERTIQSFPFEMYERDYTYEDKLNINYFCWKHLLPLTKNIQDEAYYLEFLGYGNEITLKNGYVIRNINIIINFVIDSWLLIYPELEIK